MIETRQALLQMRDIDFGYHPKMPVLQAMQLHANPGRFHVLLGPNGCGKTTALRVILGQLSPQRGRVTLDGKSVHAMSAKARARRISYVPQRSSTPFAFTVRQIVEMARFAVDKPHADDAIEKAIQRCAISELENRPYVELSLGQQQRVLLARALAQLHGGRDCLLLLDEPTAAMDLNYVHHTMRILQEQAQAGWAVVAVMHDLNLAGRYADHLWLMSQGGVIHEGSPQQVITAETLRQVYGIPVRILEDPQTARPIVLPPQ